MIAVTKVVNIYKYDDIYNAEPAGSPLLIVGSSVDKLFELH
jgi:hypothetical protein